jgi:threonine/homoserine/homoserine lactone efflux protein
VGDSVNALWEGALAGYGIAIPVGAIAVLIVDAGLRRGFGYGFVAGAGAATADLVYASVAAITGEALSAVLAPFAGSLQVVSALVLLALGWRGLRRAREAGIRPATKQASADSHGLVATYTRFLGLTLLNPLTLAYFGALILGQQQGPAMAMVDRAAFVLGAGLASLSWQTLLAGVGALSKQYLSLRFQMYASVVGNLVVMGLGVRLLVAFLA